MQAERIDTASAFPAIPVVVPAAGDLDHAAVLDLEQRVRSALEGCPDCLRMDFGAVTYIDSAGLGLLFDIRRRLPVSGRLILVDPAPRVLRLMTIVGLLNQPGVSVEGRPSAGGASLPKDPASGH